MTSNDLPPVLSWTMLGYVLLALAIVPICWLLVVAFVVVAG